MGIAVQIKEWMDRSSWIRKMFEEGSALQARYGAENVFDFTLGNPDLEPPELFSKVLKQKVDEQVAGKHGYMPNAGYVATRKSVADYLSQEHKIEITQDQVVMTCGAGGALNVVLKTLLNPGEEVIILVPYFVEYLFYVSNHGGSCKPVKTREDFSLNLAAIEETISSKTKAIIINSPNNPTGRVYDEASLKGLGELLEKKSAEMGKIFYLISDEPYGKIIYDSIKLPSVLSAYPNSILVTSYSKELSIPGERIGFIAVSPRAQPLGELMEGMVFCNRTLGFVNAPALMQRVVEHLQGISVDVSVYQKRRDILCSKLASFGYRFAKPEGAFYLFPRTPTDDVEFVQELQTKNILTVPGRGFGMPGFFRIAYCVSEEVIERSLDGFQEVAKKHQLHEIS
ncbi:MAG: pyridoxal phosphate-dependent aminotransferase [Thermodesulfobacteriota bacterium]|nr:pyridoxal phosphate-dependent aminotransferase [Thermodesulfobacteriota bacterium]